MNILAFDTSAQVSSVCVLNETSVLAEGNINVKRTHSQTLLPLCESILHCAGLTLDNIDAFAVSAGPGSFTGLRIGVAAVKGMAMPQNKPCIPVSTLEALAYSVSGLADGIVCCAMDARRNQVYNAIFRVKQGNVSRLCEDRAISIDALLDECKKWQEPIFLVGDGAHLCYTVYEEIQRVSVFSSTADMIPSGIRFIPEPWRLQKAVGVGLCAQKHLANGETVSAAALAPRYLRLPQAERERLERLKQQKNKGVE